MVYNKRMNKVTHYYSRTIYDDGVIVSDIREFTEIQGRPFQYVFIDGYRKDHAERIVDSWNGQYPDRYQYSLEPFTD